MSPSVKLGLLTLISAAAAHPQYGGHSKFHSKSSGGYAAPSGTGSARVPYPTGGWQGAHNETAAGPTGYGGKTTTLIETDTSIATEYSTIYAHQSSGASVVGAQAVSSGYAAASSAAGQCGPATVYVTAQNTVTVTVPAGGAAVSSAAKTSAVSYALASSSAAAASSSPAGGYAAPASSSSVAAEAFTHTKASSSAVAVSSAASSYVAPSSAKAVSVAVSSAAASSYAAPSSAQASSAVASSVVSSASPSSSASTGGNTYSGGKRGLGYAKADIELCSNFKSAPWAYNWESVATSNGGSLPSGTKFIPTIHNSGFISVDQWTSDVATAVAAGAPAVFGFNEADMSGNMAPTACDTWAQYAEPIRKAHPNLPIVGPSVSNSPNTTTMGLGWYQTFVKSCPNAIYDAINFHFYDNYDENVFSRFKSHCETASSISPNGKYWVTEFALNAGATDEQSAEFLKQAQSYLDSDANCQGYAYFKVGTGSLQLITGSALNTIGEAYTSS